PYVRFAVEYTVKSHMNAKNLLLPLVIQDCIKVLQRKIHVQLLLVDQCRSADDVEILNRDHKVERAFSRRCWRWEICFPIGTHDNVDFWLKNCQFEQVDALLQERA